MTVEIAGYTTLMLLTLLLGVQVIMWGMAALGAHYTADHAAQVTRLRGGSTTAGRADAQTMLASAVGGALHHPHLTLTRTTTTVTVTVSGTATSVLPGIAPPVSVTVHAPVERTS
ncbi:MAG: TadE family protein [Actinobacteria bacterium]|nr:TadE family protein [Actinomycetota bacterium]